MTTLRAIIKSGFLSGHLFEALSTEPMKKPRWRDTGDSASSAEQPKDKASIRPLLPSYLVTITKTALSMPRTILSGETLWAWRASRWPPMVTTIRWSTLRTTTCGRRILEVPPVKVCQRALVCLNLQPERFGSWRRCCLASVVDLGCLQAYGVQGRVEPSGIVTLEGTGSDTCTWRYSHGGDRDAELRRVTKYGEHRK